MLVNGKLIGRAEIVAIDDNYGLRVTELFQGEHSAVTSS
jgi:flagellar motor switch/type III secretory pathway protein FliN